MNVKIILTFVVLANSLVSAQTLFVPGGLTSSGVGTSTQSGNVGINTSAPQSKFQVFAGNTAGGSGGLSIYGTNGTSPKLYLAGDAANAFAATLAYNSSTGNLDITPRSGYATAFVNGKVRIQDPSNTYNTYLYGYMVSGYRSGLINESDGSINYGLTGPNTSGFVYRWLSSNGTALDYSTDNSEIMRLTKDGKLGVGTASPAERITVGNGGKIRIQDGSNTYNNYIYGLFANGNQRSGQIIHSDGSINFGLSGPNAQGYVFRWLSSDGNTIDYTADNNEIMRLTKDGKLGIGTTTPAERITVANGGKIRIQDGSNTYNNYAFGFMTGSYRSGLVNESDGSMNYGLTGPNSSGFVFRWLSSSGSSLDYSTDNSEIMRLTKDGKLGIGTNNPDAKLAVKGQIHTQEVKVDLTGSVTPDYVFEPDYDLTPLTEVETYVKENKHLPEVPSAKQMEEEGLNLKEMNLLLLKKVEELTLHLIEQQKQISSLSKENKEIKTRVGKVENKIN
jgi:hypothetical protein